MSMFLMLLRTRVTSCMPLMNARKRPCRYIPCLRRVCPWVLHIAAVPQRLAVVGVAGGNHEVEYLAAVVDDQVQADGYFFIQFYEATVGDHSGKQMPHVTAHIAETEVLEAAEPSVWNRMSMTITPHRACGSACSCVACRHCIPPRGNIYVWLWKIPYCIRRPCRKFQ